MAPPSIWEAPRQPPFSTYTQPPPVTWPPARRLIRTVNREAGPPCSSCSRRIGQADEASREPGATRVVGLPALNSRLVAAFGELLDRGHAELRHSAFRFGSFRD